MLGRVQNFLDKITELVKQIQQFSGNRKKKVRRLDSEVFRVSYLSNNEVYDLETEKKFLRELWSSHFVLLSIFCFYSIPVFLLTFFFIISFFINKNKIVVTLMSS